MLFNIPVISKMRKKHCIEVSVIILYGLFIGSMFVLIQMSAASKCQHLFCIHTNSGACIQVKYVSERCEVALFCMLQSQTVPAGIRKVNLGHKYLISVCRP